MQQTNFDDTPIFQYQQNQFLSEQMQYEGCPFCNRRFFRGKLVYHLKLCNKDNPMTKSKKVSPKHKKNALSAANSYERCSKCQTRVPSYLLEKHQDNCMKMTNNNINSNTNSINNMIRTKATSYKHTPQPNQSQNQVLFPKIRKTAKQITTNPKNQKKLTFFSSQIKIRDDLRCLRKAEQVQKVTCDSCGRKFSEPASLRHIPVCSNLKAKQKKQIVSFINNNANGNIEKKRNYVNGSLKIRSARANKQLNKLITKSYVATNMNQSESQMILQESVTQNINVEKIQDISHANFQKQQQKQILEQYSTKQSTTRNTTSISVLEPKKKNICYKQQGNLKQQEKLQAKLKNQVEEQKNIICDEEKQYYCKKQEEQGEEYNVDDWNQ